MTPSLPRAAGCAALMCLLSACGTVPLAQARRDAQALLRPAAGGLADPAADAASAERELLSLLASPLDAAGAARIAWLRNADVQDAYARLGIAAADVFAASRPANPRLGLALLWPAERTAARRADGTLDFGLDDLLRLTARRRTGKVALRAAEQQLAARLYALALDAQDAWLETVSTEQQLTVQRDVAASAQLAADLASRYRAAGNISELNELLQRAMASEARIRADEAARQAARSRSRLRQLLGLTAADPAVRVPASLPPPDDFTADAATLRAQARSQRLDVAAARSEADALEQRLATTRRYRLTDGSRLGATAERDGTTHRAGLGVGVELPLFSQGQPAIARAGAQVQIARARVQSLEVAIDADIDAQLAQLALARDQYREYRENLLPGRESAVTRLTEQANFMLSSPFELLLARQQSYAAYQGAIEALQSWWAARIALTRALGAPLPAIHTEK